MSRSIALALALMLSAPLAAQAAPADVAAAVAASDRPADAVKLDEGRKPAELLAFLGLEEGDSALDLFTGTGYFAEIMARAVGPEGSVLAWEPANFYDDKAKAMLSALTTRTPNVEVLATPATAPAFPAERFDFAIINLNYHDAYWESDKYKFPRMEPAAFLAAIHAAMKPGAVIGVVDHVAAPGGDTRQVVETLHRIDPAVIRADFEKAGFVLDGESELLRNPADDHMKSVFDPAIRGKTDRVVYRFRKPAA